MELLKRYIDDDFIFLPLKLNFENIKTCLNNADSTMKFIFQKPEILYENKNKVQVSNFLDVKIILRDENSVETDIYYKPLNTYDFLPYDSAHPNHTTNSIPHNLANRIS